MRRAARTDANQSAIVDRLRSIGWSVHVTSALGGGFPDLVVARDRYTVLVEIKDGDKPASARKLTKDEREFARDWPGHYIVATSPDDADVKLCEIYYDTANL